MARVAMIIQRYLPHVGGAERQLQQLAPRLRDRGYEVCILTRHEKGLMYREVIDGVLVHRLPSIGPKPLAAATFTASALIELARMQPDLVHAHEVLTPSSIAILSKNFNRHPVLVKILRGGARGDIYKLKRRPHWRSYFEKLRRKVDAFVVISTEIDQELNALEVPAQKRAFIPNGVDTQRCAPVSQDQKMDLRARLSLPAGATLVVYAGRLVPEKRADHLLRIWSAIRTEYSDAFLLILGEGSDEPRLRKMLVEGVQFAGQVPDAVPYLQAADLFVLPSATEGLSNSMLEAMSCGLPVLATSVGGASDVIEHNTSGYLIPPDDLDALKRAVEYLLGDSQLRLQLGSNARTRILSDYSLDSVAERLAALYHRLLMENGNQKAP